MDRCLELDPLSVVEATKAYERRKDSEIVAALRGSGGNYPLAMRRTAEVLEKRSAKAYVSSGTIARLYAYAGDREKALSWLQRTYQAHDEGLLTLNTAPVWDRFRDDPRFQDILRQMKFSAQGAE